MNAIGRECVVKHLTLVLGPFFGNLKLDTSKEGGIGA